MQEEENSSWACLHEPDTARSPIAMWQGAARAWRPTGLARGLFRDDAGQEPREALEPLPVLKHEAAANAQATIDLRPLDGRAAMEVIGLWLPR